MVRSSATVCLVDLIVIDVLVGKTAGCAAVVGNVIGNAVFNVAVMAVLKLATCTKIYPRLLTAGARLILNSALASAVYSNVNDLLSDNLVPVGGVVRGVSAIKADTVYLNAVLAVMTIAYERKAIFVVVS